MIDVPLKDIDKVVIESLIANQVRESRRLEYKEKLPGGKNEEKKEFLADVSAMANAAGGDIVYGISECRENDKPTGLPAAIAGLAVQSIDAESLRLENMMRDGIDPRINGIQFQWVTGFDAGPALVMRIPKSHLAPHMLSQGDSRFYSRNSASKYPLDVTEIRSAFALSESLPEKARRFRDERLERLRAVEGSFPLPSHPKTVLHLLPLGALGSTTRIDTAPVERVLPGTSALINPHTLYGLFSRHNHDGFIVGARMGAVADIGGYLQVFRDGAIEAVDCAMLLRQNTGGPVFDSSEDTGEFTFHSPEDTGEFTLNPLIPAVAFERSLIEAMSAIFDC